MDKRNSKLFETIRELNGADSHDLLAYLSGWENDCKHFHDGIEGWLRIFHPEIVVKETKGD